MGNPKILKRIALSALILFCLACEEKENPRYVPGEDITTLLQEDLDNDVDIVLPAGKFYVSKTLYGKEYCGSISGAGKGVTEITAAPGFKSIDFAQQGVLDAEVACFFGFYAPICDISISDLTFIITGESPADPHLGAQGTRTSMDFVIGLVGGTEVPVEVNIKNIEVLGEYTYFETTNHRNIGQAFAVGGNENIDKIKAVSLLVENCDLENLGIAGIHYFRAGGGSGTDLSGSASRTISSNCSGKYLIA